MLSGSCVLVVEDDPLIAMVICDNVDSVGGTVAGPFSTVGEALTFLTQAKIDAAIVDANLRDRRHASRTFPDGNRNTLHSVQRCGPSSRAARAASRLAAGHEARKTVGKAFCAPSERRY